MGDIHLGPVHASTSCGDCLFSLLVVPLPFSCKSGFLRWLRFFANHGFPACLVVGRRTHATAFVVYLHACHLPAPDNSAHAAGLRRAPSPPFRLSIITLTCLRLRTLYACLVRFTSRYSRVLPLCVAFLSLRCLAVLRVLTFVRYRVAGSATWFATVPGRWRRSVSVYVRVLPLFFSRFWVVRLRRIAFTSFRMVTHSRTGWAVCYHFHLPCRLPFLFPAGPAYIQVSVGTTCCHFCGLPSLRFLPVTFRFALPRYYCTTLYLVRRFAFATAATVYVATTAQAGVCVAG